MDSSGVPTLSIDPLGAGLDDMSRCVSTRRDGTCDLHGGGPGPCLVKMGEILHAQREQARAEHGEVCAYVSATLWWKAEALLATVGKATPMDRLLLAAVIPIPIPRDVAEAHMEEAKAAILEWERANGKAGRA